MPCAAHREVGSHFVNSGLAGGCEFGIPRHGNHAGHGHTGADLHIADIGGLALVVLELDDELVLPLHQFAALIQQDDGELSDRFASCWFQVGEIDFVSPAASHSKDERQHDRIESLHKSSP